MSEYPIFDIGVLDDIGNMVRDIAKHLIVLRLQPYILPQRSFAYSVFGQFVSRRLRIPFLPAEVVVVGLARKKVRV